MIHPKMKEEAKTRTCRLLDLPWEDVLVAHILSCLPFRQLVCLQRVNKEFRRLIRLYFAKCRSFDPIQLSIPKEAFRFMLKDNKVLQKLSLQSCSHWLTDDELLPVVSQNRRLLTVDMTGCVRLTRHSLVALSLTRCLHLQHLTLAQCSFVDGLSLRSLADHCGALRSIDLTGCCQLKDDAICYLAKKCPKLTFLSLAVNENITDESVEEVAKNCRSLEHLDLNCCLRVRNQSIRTLGEYCPNLQSLKVKHCHQVTESSLEPLRKRNVRINVDPPPERPLLSHVLRYTPFVNLQEMACPNKTPSLPTVRVRLLNNLPWGQRKKQVPAI
ncbi:F-box/LRR-repeat protein 15 isoform X2 [Dunckerocampus dactyliophorus]|uniref:F-box/LRR-repeat protein 15 isoform X2 n=1 Tax=Dunckerocampus dactyliophorus TaxID=161453 RepID=UPI0024049450|nr:F-box/LRR-repeat protein 15 isoform X2 [Dunckerocampus dactyliophorus]